MDRIAVIDGNSLINRAYYAMRNPMMTKEGIYTQGIFGFLNMMEKIRRDYEPTHMAVAFDLKAPTFRHKEYDMYKAGRKKMPPELAMQIPLLKDVLSAMRIKRIEIEGFEADDIIGTIVKRAEDAGIEPYIITGDKDELQLASDKTKVIITRKGVSEFDIYDEQAMIDKYGFTPLQFIDYKGLMGDQSDNIPGVPGVGEKTASKLIKEFGSIDAVIENIDKVTPKGVRTKIEENIQLALMSRRLATINTSVPIDIDFDEYRLTDPDYDALIEIYTKLEFNKFLKKLNVSKDAAVHDDSPKAEARDLSEIRKTIVRDGKTAEDIELAGEAVMKVFGDASHLGDVSIDGVALLCGDDYFYFCGESLPVLIEKLGKADISYTGHGLKRDYFILMNKGLEGFSTAFDTEIAQYVLDPGRSGYSLSGMSNEYLHTTVEDEKELYERTGQTDMFTDSTESFSEYGLRACAAVAEIRRIQEAKIEKDGLERVLYDIEFPLIEVMAAMEKEGFRVDRKTLDDFGREISGRIDELTETIYGYAGKEFNINSTIQLGEVLFEDLGLPAGKKTKRGYSTSADILEKIKDAHPIVPAILEYRTLTKLKGTYVDGMIPMINAGDGRVHAHFNQTVTATGRISCTEPNLQNIPIRQELGRQLRKAFIPDDEGCVLVGADYSQIELRVLAHMSGDEALIESFNNGEDIHKATASRVLGIPEDEITPGERSRAKAVNFGVIYGMSAFGLSSELDITRKEADEYIKAYFAKHAAVKSFMDRQVSECRERGYVTTMMGRRRYIKEINARAYMVRQIGERLAMNSPIQGSAADIIKIAMIKVYRALKEHGLASKLILQVHDELIINTKKDEKEIVEKLLTENMEDACELAVKLKADLNEGNNWYELK